MEGLVGEALRNAIAEAGFRPILEPRPAAEAVAQVDCVIAEASSRDSNTMYSLGIASALGRPTVIISRSLESLPSELSGLQVLQYEDDPASLKVLQKTMSGILRSLGPLTGPRRLMLAARNENLFAVNWDRLDPQDTDNLCVELLTQMGFRQVQWEPRVKEFDLVAELPKKDPDGFDFKERWYVTLGRNAPPEMLMDMLREPEYFFHRLRRYSDEKGMESLAQEPVTVLVILIREGMQRKLWEHSQISAEFTSTAARCAGKWRRIDRLRLWHVEAYSSRLNQMRQHVCWRLNQMTRFSRLFRTKSRTVGMRLGLFNWTRPGTPFIAAYQMAPLTSTQEAGRVASLFLVAANCTKEMTT